MMYQQNTCALAAGYCFSAIKALFTQLEMSASRSLQIQSNVINDSIYIKREYKHSDGSELFKLVAVLILSVFVKFIQFY